MKETNRFAEYEKEYPRTEYVYSNLPDGSYPDDSYDVFYGDPIAIKNVPALAKASSLEIELIEIYIVFPSLIKDDKWDEYQGDLREELSGIFSYFYYLINDLVKDKHPVSFRVLYEIHENKEIRDFIRELKIEAEARKLIGDDSISFAQARLQAHLCIERLARYTEYKREHLL